MKTLFGFILFLAAVTLVHAEKISLVGATVINPADGSVVATIPMGGRPEAR